MRRRAPVALTAAALLIAGTASITTAGNAGAAPTGPASAAAAKPTPAAYMRSHAAAPKAVARPAEPAVQARAHARLDPRAAHQRSTKNGTVRVAVRGDAASIARSARRLGGRTLTSAGGTSSVLVPKDRLVELADTPGVSAVDAAERPYKLEGAPNEGAAASGAVAWQAAGQTGAGTKLAIVDSGFGVTQAEFDAAAAAGELGTDPQLVNESCTDASNASTSFIDPHGLAVAEVAHDSAPGAQLVLYCIDDLVGMANAEAAIEAAHIKIASSSLGWYGDSRGDGTGPAGSAAAIVAKARKAGILWIQSAGNDAGTHWGRVMGDADKDHVLDLNGTFSQTKHIFEDDFIYVAPQAGDVPGAGAVVLQWDEWPTTTTAVTLSLYGYQCTAPFGGAGIDTCDAVAINPDSNGDPRAVSASHVSGKKPVVVVDTTQFPNTGGFDQVWEVVVHGPTTLPTRRWDLNYLGDLDGVSDDACASVTAQGTCVLSVNAYSHSISAPANSPYALAVGAADVGVDGRAPGTLEFFSSQGPSIDGRVKPDITGWDGVTSQVPEFSDGFYGTSAAAPNVAGAAAVVAGANPQLDAAQIQNFLQQRANFAAPKNPPTNAVGHGLLTLGSAVGGAPAPAGARYQPIAQTRILDTRTTTGGHKAALTAGGTLTLTVPGLPVDATAVAINLTGTGATAGTSLAAYAAGTGYPTTVNLALSTLDPTAAVFAIVAVHDGAITIRNASGTAHVIVDELGYFGTGTETGRLTSSAAAHRVLDTRTTNGGHHGKLVSGGTITVDPVAPEGATAAVVNLTATAPVRSGHASVAAACTSTSSTLNYNKYTRANLAIVTLDAAHRFCLETNGGAADFIVDVQGFIGASGSEYVALPSARRIVDTRNGNGGVTGGRASLALGAGSRALVYGSNVGVVPAAATGLFTNVNEATATASAYLTVFPGITVPTPRTSNVNFSAGRSVSNAVIANLPPGSAPAGEQNRFGIYNSGGSTNVSVDLVGYFQAATG